MTYSYHEKMRMLGATESMIAAIDILQDAELLNETRLKVVLAKELEGHDPETYARELVRLFRMAENTEPRGR